MIKAYNEGPRTLFIIQEIFENANYNFLNFIRVFKVPSLKRLLMVKPHLFPFDFFLKTNFFKIKFRFVSNFSKA